VQTVDLTHPLETDIPVYPGTDPVRVEPASTRERDGYRTTRLDLDSHAGTHVDTPAHLLDGPGLDDFPTDRFAFDAASAPLPSLGPRDPIGESALREALPADPAAVDIVVVATGWDDNWGTDRYFDHPYLTREAAAWLADAACDLGVDTINPDPTPTDDPTPNEPDGFPVHETLFAHDRLIVENLRGLDRVPERFELLAHPLRVAGAEAAPVRAIGRF